jgi:hypothetical protein
MYATLEYYKTTYLGAIDTDSNITKWLSRASDDIDITCLYKIPDTLTEQETIFLQKACCSQAENYVINGDGLADSASLSLGSFSISNSTRSAERLPVVCAGAMKFLAFTGFANRAIGSSLPRTGHYR